MTQGRQVVVSKANKSARQANKWIRLAGGLALLMALVVALGVLGGCVELPTPGAVAIQVVSTPEAPVILPPPDSVITNTVCVGDCYTGGRASWVTSDVIVGWTHPDPLSVDEYEVWRSTQEPYFEPESCTACELEATTSGLEATVTGSPPGFNPVGGTAGSANQTDLDFYLVRAVNAGGTSEASNRIGVMSYSLMQGSIAPGEP